MARAKKFDEDAVLLKAMKLFWEQGYEKTSIKDLVAHTGIHKGSMYDTFGDKQSLYIKALIRFIEMNEQSIKRLRTEPHSTKEVIRSLFDMAVRQREELPDGCFIVNTAVELAKHDAESKEWVLTEWARLERLLYDLIVAGQQSGELSNTLNAEWLSQYFNNALIGVRVMVKSITDRDKLQHIIDMNMSILD
jgi:TetR/AcrR family transcriptional repressor of nem operon